MRIYNQFNLPFHAKPGEDLFAAARLDVIQRMGGEVYARVAAGQEPEDAQRQVEDFYFNKKVQKLSILLSNVKWVTNH